MEILGVGVPELMFIVLIALILLGPKDMIAAGKTFGKVLRKFLTSPEWRLMRKTGEELQQLPTKLIREAGLEDLQNEVRGVTNQLKSAEIKKSFDEALVFDPNSLKITEDSSKTAQTPTLPTTIPTPLPEKNSEQSTTKEY
jgi:Sec-independent protein translocase protein TatA